MELKNIYTGNEVKYAALFRAVQAALLKDFVVAHPEFIDNTKELSGLQNKPITYAYNAPGAWKISPIEDQALGGVCLSNIEKYTTAHALVAVFGDHCVRAAYNVLEPGGIIYRHTDKDNRDAKLIRVHVPLSIPDGDVGFEVNGDTVLWDDVFAFNNQKLHSAWNLTSRSRLTFIIDLTREYMDLPLAPAWHPGCNNHVSIFEKTLDPNYKK